MLDLILAIAHHLFIFSLFGVLLAEWILLCRDMDLKATRGIASIDRWYGVLAVLILIVGFSRAVYGAKGWNYYASNGFFWAKIGVFACVGVTSILPTIHFIRWRRAEVVPDDQVVKAMRQPVVIELLLFALLPAFAAAMARGYGEY